MKFTKMHGIGNDYIYLFGETTLDLSAFARKYSPRHTGIGSDGVIHITLSQDYDFHMTMYNADGSLGSMCGNGIRCVGKYLYDQGLTRKTSLVIGTQAGARHLQLRLGQDGRVKTVVVDMGTIQAREPLSLDCEGRTFHGTYINVGNPHFVIPCVNPMEIPLEIWGKQLQEHPHFTPSGVNVEFVTQEEDGFFFRVWERGSGETQACGTGACACYAFLSQENSTEMTARLLGGTLKLWKKQEHIMMEGEAVTVYHGELSTPLSPLAT